VSEPPRRASSDPAARPADKGAFYGALVDELEEARRRRLRAGGLRIGVGLALMIVGLVVTVVSGGAMIWYGAPIAGALLVARGAAILVGT